MPGKKKSIPGRMRSGFNDTYGFPLDLDPRDCAWKHGFQVDEQGVQRAMAEQRERARVLLSTSVPTNPNATTDPICRFSTISRTAICWLPAV